MPLMRDKGTGVIRDVPERTLDRWPEDYEHPDTARKREAARRRAARTADPKKRPSKKSTATPAVGAIETPEGEE